MTSNQEEFFVQRRSLNKKYCPGYLDITFGGLVRFGNFLDFSTFSRENKKNI